jgi:ribosome-binding factor A
VTAVRITPDLRHARVFVSVMGTPDEQVETMNGLRSATSHLKAELSRQVRIKYTPDLVFELDHGPEEAQHLEELIRQIHLADEERS